MIGTSRIRALAVRVVLTAVCLGCAGFWTPNVQTATAQNVRRCSNTGCVGIDRCYFNAGISCSMTNLSCTNTGC
ncbi:hypothetical protein [Longimicrobium terrae]|uniref:Uncharacterized protein n=1 Tax=Longimicrobium terrae TaxID=1639882 RepID=A0A841GSM9_9BACT|nr:hypothetical protein [Longimicrobium terrae]MBB4635005.1 hypothetical protein [Longimicrobium terrae]MBB6069399.1 hypothetical protein [Longimicrobium terrae]NNC31795.1 hypothetical protein [Longimicrobium terrae]